MKALDKYKEENLIFFDIETASAVKKLKKGSQLEAAWLYKCRNQNEVVDKTGKQITPEEYWVQKAALYSPFGQVVTIVAGRIVEGDKLSVKAYQGSEKDLLTEFNNDLEALVTPETVLCGWQNLGFDGPYLLKRGIVHGVKSHDILDISDSKPWLAPVIDLGQLWKSGSFFPDSLISVATALGLPSPKDALDGSQVSEAFFDGRIDEIVNYCIKDVLTTANIYRKFKQGNLLTLR